MEKIIIAIDGFAGCGKSTTARQVAQGLDYIYVDTGAMYRAVTLYLLQNNIPYQSENPLLIQALDEIHIEFVRTADSNFPQISLNGEIVEDKIRTPEVSQIVSQVSVHPSVRHALVAEQQKMGKQKGLVMDGRDIGTIVFPQAELKVFMTAEIEVRARRRKEEMDAKGLRLTLDEIKENLRLRDEIDTTRKEGPLKQAPDARLLDTTELTVEQQVQIVIEWAREIIMAHS